MKNALTVENKASHHKKSIMGHFSSDASKSNAAIGRLLTEESVKYFGELIEWKCFWSTARAAVQKVFLR